MTDDDTGPRSAGEKVPSCLSISAASYYYLGYPVGYPAAKLVLGDDALLIPIRAASIAVLLAAGTTIAPWTRRLAGSEPASRRVGAAYAAIVLLQVALMLIVFFSPVIGGLQDLRLLAYAAPAMAASMAAMLAGLRSIRRSAATQVERSAARESEEQLGGYLSAMREQIDAAAVAERFRHDHRNHLTRRADRVRARRQVTPSDPKTHHLKRPISDG